MKLEMARYILFLGLILFIAVFIWNPQYTLENRRSKHPAPLGSTFAWLSHGRVRYSLSGPRSPGGGDLIVLVAGMGAPFEVMAPIAASLHNKSSKVRTLLFDVYGRGWSDSPAGPLRPGPAFELYVAQLSELLFYLNETEKITLIGLSMGGAIASGFTKVYPQRVRKLIMFAPPVIELGTPAKFFLMVLNSLTDAFLLKLGRLVIPASLAKNIENEFKTHTAQTQIVINAILAQDMDVVSSAVIMSILSMDMSSIYKTYEEMAKIFHGDVLLVWGEADYIAPEYLGRMLKNRLERFRAIEFLALPKYGHFLVCEGSEVYQSIADYIEKIVR